MNRLDLYLVDGNIENSRTGQSGKNGESGVKFGK
jgi:hypothetical protein